MSGILEKYRAAHKRLRRYLNPYTAKLCPTCPDPCCRKPTRVAEYDVMLANACGCDLPSVNHEVSNLVRAGILCLQGNPEAEGYLEPCDYLGDSGCLFPEDLRPFECARWICKYLKKEMSPGEMREVRAILHRLGVVHRELLETIAPQSPR